MITPHNPKIMLDNIKIEIKETNIINRIYNSGLFTKFIKSNNRYDDYQHPKYGNKLSISLRKEFFNDDFSQASKGEFAGFSTAYIGMNPHYHYNDYKHNGNDFTVMDCINSITDILQLLNITEKEYPYCEIVNLEYGINTDLNCLDIKNLINGIIFSEKTPFITPKKEAPYFKECGTIYTKVKAYAKGLQFQNYPDYNIPLNTFRFEIKTKKAKHTRALGIYNITDLLNPKTYNHLAEKLLKKWDNILLLNYTSTLENLSEKDKKFMFQANNPDYWQKLIKNNTRNTFANNRRKYNNILHKEYLSNLGIKKRIIDKLFYLLDCASTSKDFTQNNLRKTEILPSKKTKHTSETARISSNSEKVIFCANSPKNNIDFQQLNFFTENTLDPLRCEFAQHPQKSKLNTPKKNLVFSEQKHSNLEGVFCNVTGLDISMQKRNSKYLSFTALHFYYSEDRETYLSLEEQFLTPKHKNCDLDTRIYYIAHNIRNTVTNRYNNAKHSRRRFEARNYPAGQLCFDF